MADKSWFDYSTITNAAVAAGDTLLIGHSGALKAINIAQMDTRYQGKDAHLTNLAALSSVGIVCQSGTGGTYVIRSIVAGSAAIVITNPTGSGGNFTLNINVGSGGSQIVQLGTAGEFAAIPSQNLTGLNASALASGTVAAARLGSLVTDTPSSNVTLDLATPAGHFLQLTGDCTVGSFTNVTPGQCFGIAVQQSTDGGNVVSWPACYWPTGGPPTLATAGSHVDVLVFFPLGTGGPFVGSLAIPDAS